ncbi:MAG: carbamoyltransferase HypF [Anaerolineales bacterium]|nr:carbamoyltransferase HypF [Anaerolineales bacterium]
MKTGRTRAPTEQEGLRIHVTGVVQGVGFRPFVYSLAQRLALTGWVRNTAGGVEIEADGQPPALQAFVEGLRREAPPLARIDKIDVESRATDGFEAFSILASQPDPKAFQPIAPDVGICNDCLRELRDPSDRRYRYPFINCTNCGPRFTIILGIPYDRPNTTMRHFDLCPECDAEYADPADRRFHAQPVACPTCGPHVWLEAQGAPSFEGEAALQAARRLLAEGKILAVKGLGGFHLAVDALDPRAVERLRQRKLRVDKAFAVMLPDLEAIERHCLLGEAERALLCGWERPIVICRRRPDSTIAASLAPGQATLGVMLPYTPLHHLLIEPASGFPEALVMTSGNLSEEPIATDNDQARQTLAPLADAFLMHDRPIHVRCDDSVLRSFDGQVYPLRRSRGFAPYPIQLPWEAPSILGAGPELKNTFCLNRKSYAFLSHHIGDLENYETLESYRDGIAHLERLFRVKPQAIAYDLHPDYLATRYAHERAESEGLPLIGVQHHHAHIAAGMAEHGLPIGAQVIGVALDGTGFGEDGTIWGGEVLLAGYAGYERLFHLRPVPMPGSEAAVRQPWRMALSWLQAAGIPWDRDLPSVEAAGEQGLAAVRTMLDPQSPLAAMQPRTSSMGRLFDAAAALAGIRQQVNYEAQAAIEFEAVLDPAEPGYYSLQVSGSLIDPAPALQRLVADRRAGVPASIVSARFHRGVALGMVEVCERARSATAVATVVLSGGVWQNVALLELTVPALRARGFSVLVHRKVPANDGGVSLGQVAVAAARLSQGGRD